MTRLFKRVTGLFALWTVLGVGLAWFAPSLFLWVADGRFAPFGQPLISVMLGVIMLGMGITLRFEDFRRAVALPRQVLAGVVLQFTVMPFAGFMIAWVFGLEAGLAVGLILVACCPGGTASNVVSYLARANVALSVTMTMVSTFMAIALTPLLTGWLAGVFIEIDRWNLFRGMLTVVLIPVVAGVLMNRYLPRVTKAATHVSPSVSVIFVVVIVAGIIAHSKPLIEAHAGVLIAAVFTLHLAGFGLGYAFSKILGLREAAARTISIEVGMQNSGLGASIASSPAFARQFPDAMQAALAPVPAAISAVWHVLIGSFLASLWSRRSEPDITRSEKAQKGAVQA